jgi:hypothetical protein
MGPSHTLHNVQTLVPAHYMLAVPHGHLQAKPPTLSYSAPTPIKTTDLKYSKSRVTWYKPTAGSSVVPRQTVSWAVSPSPIGSSTFRGAQNPGLTRVSHPPHQ